MPTKKKSQKSEEPVGPPIYVRTVCTGIGRFGDLEDVCPPFPHVHKQMMWADEKDRRRELGLKEGPEPRQLKIGEESDWDPADYERFMERDKH